MVRFESVSKPSLEEAAKILEVDVSTLDTVFDVQPDADAVRWLVNCSVEPKNGEVFSNPQFEPFGVKMTAVKEQELYDARDKFIEEYNDLWVTEDTRVGINGCGIVFDPNDGSNNGLRVFVTDKYLLDKLPITYMGYEVYYSVVGEIVAY